jgi:hypothetical protein
LNEHLTRIVASCEPWGQSNEVEPLLEVATENGPPPRTRLRTKPTMAWALPTIPTGKCSVATP